MVLGTGAEGLAIVGDLTDASVPGELIEQAVDRFGGLDCLVVNAGIAIAALLAAEDASSWDRVFAVNVRATGLLAAAAYPHLRRARGSILAIGSIAGTAPHPGMGAYSASKAATAMLVRQLAQEWAPEGIRVIRVVPGFIVNPRTERVYEDERLLAERLRLVPMGRVGHADLDVAEAAAYLVSSASAYCTGQQRVVDGGLVDSIMAHDPGATAYAASTG